MTVARRTMWHVLYVVATIAAMAMAAGAPGDAPPW
jgi:hypothetical protein